jgi:hypothetical protein
VLRLSGSVAVRCVCALDVIPRGVGGWIVAVARARSVILSVAKDRGLIARVAGSSLWSHIEFAVSVDCAGVLRCAQDDNCGAWDDGGRSA